MPEYKGEVWNRKIDEDTPVPIIQNETTGNWEYVGAVKLYRHEYVLIFERPGTS